MKRLTMLLGFLCGCVAVLFVLLKNPLAATDNDSGFASAAYRWTVLEFAGNPFTPARVLGVPADFIPGSEAAEEFDYANASILLLQDEQGQPVALATRLSGVGKGGSLLQGNAGINHVHEHSFLIASWCLGAKHKHLNIENSAKQSCYTIKNDMNLPRLDITVQYFNRHR